jgi:hypothetical protein
MNDAQPTTMLSLEQNMLEDLNDNKADILKSDDPSGYVSDIASSHVPVYTADSLDVAKSDLFLATEEPDIDTKSPLQAINWNIYSCLSEQAYEWLEDNTTRRLEELREELQAEDISQGELVELQSLAKFIDEGDVELLEAAGVSEFNK